MAQGNLGIRYLYGQGVQQNYDQALYWFRKAAERGDKTAQEGLGILYENGEGVQKDVVTAALWYRKAAEQGSAEAQDLLGILYYNGEGIQQDYAQAVYWFRKAADGGNEDGENNLAEMYSSGDGVPMDDTEAVRWWQKAAEKGVAQAQYNLGVAYGTGTGGLTQDYGQAASWFQKALDKGYAHAKDALTEALALKQREQRDRDEEQSSETPDAKRRVKYAVDFNAQMLMQGYQGLDIFTMDGAEELHTTSVETAKGKGDAKALILWDEATSAKALTYAFSKYLDSFQSNIKEMGFAKMSFVDGKTQCTIFLSGDDKTGGAQCLPLETQRGITNGSTALHASFYLGGQ